MTIEEKLNPYLDLNNFMRSQEVVNNKIKINKYNELNEGLSIIILNLNKPELIMPLLNSLIQAKFVLRNKDIDLEIIVGDTGSTDNDVLKHYEEHKNEVKVKYNMKYQFSVCNNELFNEFVTKKTTLFLNNDIIFNNAAETLDFIFCHIKGNVGIAGSYLFYPDMTVQHIGVDFFKTGEAQCLCYHPNHREKINITDDKMVSNVPAVTGAFLMIKSELFSEIDGFDILYEEECQDVALCLAARRLGYEIIIASSGTVFHLENATRPKGSENWKDRRRFIRKWKLFISEVL